MQDRDVQLDILKGIGILLVVFAHVCKGSVTGVVYLFHMPLFFFLSGAALNYSRDKNVNLVKRFRHIMVPYFVFSVLCFLYWCFIEIRFRPVSDVSLFGGELGLLDLRLQQFINVFTAFSLNDSFVYNIVLWFLPCLLVALVIYLLLKRWLGKCVGVGVVVISSIAFTFSNLRLPWCMEIAAVALPFILEGEMLYSQMKSQNALWGGLFLLFSIFWILIFKPHIDMRCHNYDCWWSFYIVASILIFATCVFSRFLIGKEYGIIGWLGKNSLAIMCIHEPIKRILLVVISKVTGWDIGVLRDSVFYSICTTIVLIAVLSPIVLGINRYFPIVLGNKRKSSFL